MSEINEKLSILSYLRMLKWDITQGKIKTHLMSEIAI